MEVSASNPRIITGFVQYCLNNYWSTVCARNPGVAWDMNEAQVVCRQLGYQGKVVLASKGIGKLSKMQVTTVRGDQVV